MSTLVKLTAATFIIPGAGAFALGALAFTATTTWEAIRLAMWSGICGLVALAGIGLAYSFHRGDLSEVREAERDEQVAQQRQAYELLFHNMGQQIGHLRQELAIHTAIEAFHQAAGMPQACGVIPIDKRLRSLPTPRVDQQEASERN